MTWVRVDDQFPDHPKVLEAGPAAAWLFVCGLAYAARYLTDGFIPQAQVRRLADMDGTVAAAERLVETGLWESAPGGFQIHDYLEYQPSAEQVHREREEARQRMAARRSGKGRANIGGSSGELRSNFGRSSASPARPGPASPGPGPGDVPVRPPEEVNSASGPEVDEEEGGAAAAPAAASVPESVKSLHASLTGTPGYEPSPAFLEKVATKYGHLDLEEEALKMLGWLRGQPKPKRRCSTAFVLNWLDRTAQGQASAQPRASPNGRARTGLRGPGGRQELTTAQFIVDCRQHNVECDANEELPPEVRAEVEHLEAIGWRLSAGP